MPGFDPFLVSCTGLSFYVFLEGTNYPNRVQWLFSLGRHTCWLQWCLLYMRLLGAWGGGLLLYRKKRRLCSVQPLVTRSSDDGKGYLGASWHLICSLQLENTDLPWNCPPRPCGFDLWRGGPNYPNSCSALTLHQMRERKCFLWGLV